MSQLYRCQRNTSGSKRCRHKTLRRHNGLTDCGRHGDQYVVPLPGDYEFDSAPVPIDAGIDIPSGDARIEVVEHLIHDPVTREIQILQLPIIEHQTPSPELFNQYLDRLKHNVDKAGLSEAGKELAIKMLYEANFSRGIHELKTYEPHAGCDSAVVATQLHKDTGSHSYMIREIFDDDYHEFYQITEMVVQTNDPFRTLGERAKEIMAHVVQEMRDYAEADEEEMSPEGLLEMESKWYAGTGFILDDWGSGGAIIHAERQLAQDDFGAFPMSDNMQYPVGAECDHAIYLAHGYVLTGTLLDTG